MAAPSNPVEPSASGTPFRLFVLGDLPRDGGDVELVSLSEYHQARALARTTLRAAELEAIRKAILDLRGFIEAGSPVLERRFLEELGGRLFDLVIRSQVRDLFIAATAQRRDFVPFELFIESSALASWPWEYLFDTGARMFVCREFHPVSRSVFGQTFSLALGEVRARPRLLVVIGSTDDDELDVDEEVALLRTVFERLLKQDRFDIVAEPMSARELTTRLQKSRGEFDILHFLGHSGFDLARGEGYLRLKKAGVRETTRLYANDFAQAVADSRIRLAFLNACETARAAVAEDPARSSVAAALLQRGVPAVVAHQFSVPDNGAHFFAGVFYDMLSDGLPLIDAVRAGRAAMGYAEDGRFFDWGIPVLYTRDPQAVVFPTPPADDVRSPRFAALDSGNPPQQRRGPDGEEFRRYSPPGSPAVAPGLPAVSSDAAHGVLERPTDGLGATWRNSGHSVARLLFRDSQGREGTVELSPTETVYIGRGLECAIRTDDGMVSRKHSLIRMEGGRFVVEDLGSANGTHLNNVRVQKRALGHADIIQCGSLMIRFIEEGTVHVARQQMPGGAARGGFSKSAASPSSAALYGGPPAMSSETPDLLHGGSSPMIRGEPPMIVCHRCGKENLDHYKFCLGCGTELTAGPKPGGDMARMKTMMADAGADPSAPLGGGVGPGLGGGGMGPGGLGNLGGAGFSPGFAAPSAAAGVRRCLSCGSDVPPSFRLCGTCGFHMDEASSPMSMPMPMPPAGGMVQPMPRTELSMTLIRPDGTEGAPRQADAEAKAKVLVDLGLELDPSKADAEIKSLRAQLEKALANHGAEMGPVPARAPQADAENKVPVDLGLEFDPQKVDQEIQSLRARLEKALANHGAAIEGEIEVGGERVYYDDGFGGRTKGNTARSAHAKADQIADVRLTSIAAPRGAETIQRTADRLGKGTRPPRQPRSATAELTVALVDIDARAGFLAATLEAANRAQRYYEFRLDYLPVPSGAVRRDLAISPTPQLFISALEGFATETPRQLGADRVCFLTRNLVAGHGWANLFAAALDDRHEVFFISTADMREFAHEAGQSFAKAVLRICLSMLVASDKRWNLDLHAETAGCLFDHCDNRHDIVGGLRKRAFDHAPCRSKIKDGNLLAAIDAILALDA